MTSPISQPPVNQRFSGTFAHRVNQFQKMALVNRALLDVVAVDTVYVGLANNNKQRQERFIRQALVLLLGFMVAPLHALLLSRWFSYQHRLPQPLMQLPMANLTSMSALKQGYKNLLQEIQENPEQARQLLKLPITPGLRRRLIQAKSGLLMTDLAAEGGLYASIPLVKNACSHLWITQSGQAAGEQGVVSPKALAAIYEQEARQKTQRQREIGSVAAGVLGPLAFGLLFRKALSASPHNHRNPGLFLRSMQWLMPKFDYVYPRSGALKGLPLMKIGPLFVVAVINSIADVVSARSTTEAKELATTGVLINALFFFGDGALMALLRKFSTNRFKLPFTTSVENAIASAKKLYPKHPSMAQKAADRAAQHYLLSYLINIPATAGIVYGANKLTQRNITAKAQQLEPAS